ncbi:MAG: hypothetical protein BM558_10270 [Roseobacter sp. MedPE-SW]|nr:MAG: hypothetical protein BM558_10270 [Roseobacter sp. MedPE-SW]
MRHDTLRRRHQLDFGALQKFRQTKGVVIKACEVAANAQILVHHTKNKPLRSQTVIASRRN